MPVGEDLFFKNNIVYCVCFDNLFNLFTSIMRTCRLEKIHFSKITRFNVFFSICSKHPTSIMRTCRLEKIYFSKIALFKSCLSMCSKLPTSIMRTCRLEKIYVSKIIRFSAFMVSARAPSRRWLRGAPGPQTWGDPGN